MNEYSIVDLFEKTVADYAGSKYAVAVDSCTNALFLSLMYSGIKDRHITIPSHTYISVPFSIIHAGGKPVFQDKTWSGFYFLEPTNIVDSALRFTQGMYIKDTLYCLSFHVKKHLNIGKGGMILTDSKKAYEWLKFARFNGRSGKKYVQEAFNMVGWNMYMTPEDAARGLRIFKTLDKNNPDLTDEYPDLNKYDFENAKPGQTLNEK
jgi:dTDP-4-amino-4,6-dideoxygalactose transaminase